MNKLLRNSVIARECIPIGDVNTLPTCTEPDQTLSIKQIIERHVNGISMGVTEYEPYYTDEEIPDFETMDLNELHSYRQFLNEQKFRAEDRLRQLRQEEIELKAQDRLRSEAKTDAGGTRQAPPTEVQA